MAIGNICVREVNVADRNTTVADAAHMMRQQHVGDLVVVESGSRKPVAIVTDRDIVLSVVATKLDPDVFTLGDLVVRKLVTCPEDQGIFECIQLMRMHGVRRMPVVNGTGQLVGIVSVDDLIRLLAEEMSELSKLIQHEQAEEVNTRR